MNDKQTTTSIEILGKIYSIRCPESEVDSLQEAAQHLNQKMLEVQDSGKTINLERIAIISGLNIAHQLLQKDKQKDTVMQKINHRISHLQDKIEAAINKSLQTEFVYSTE